MLIRENNVQKGQETEIPRNNEQQRRGLEEGPRGLAPPCPARKVESHSSLRQKRMQKVERTELCEGDVSRLCVGVLESSGWIVGM